MCSNLAFIVIKVPSAWVINLTLSICPITVSCNGIGPRVSTLGSYSVDFRQYSNIIHDKTVL